MIKSFLNKKHIISTVVATILLSGCFGDNTEEKEAPSTKTITENVQDIKDSSKEIASKVVEQTKSQTTQIVEKAQDTVSDVADNVKETTTNVVEKAQDVAATTVAVATEKLEEVLPPNEPSIDATKLYAKCIACHGTNGEKVALGKSKIIKDMSQEDFIAAMTGYQNGTYGGSMKGVMGGQVKGLNEAEIKALASHIIK